MLVPYDALKEPQNGLSWESIKGDASTIAETLEGHRHEGNVAVSSSSTTGGPSQNFRSHRGRPARLRAGPRRPLRRSPHC